HEVRERLSAALGEVAVTELLGAARRLAGVADRDPGERPGALGDLVELAGPVRQDADHLVHGESSRGGLDEEAAGREAALLRGGRDRDRRRGWASRSA